MGMENQMKVLNGKKLLILGGANLHCDLVIAAKNLGVETFVTDYLPIDKAPAKQLADHFWDLDVTDVDAIVERCRIEHIDGVMNMYYDPCQLPYQRICEIMGLPCFGTREQFQIFTDKKSFIDVCAYYGIDVIPSYKEDDFVFDNPKIEYPVYVKPSDSRGSRGQSICNSYAEVESAIKLARSESINGGVIIERFMEHAQDLQVTLMMIDGEPYIENTADMYSSIDENGSILPYALAVAPAFREEYILELVRGKIGAMLKGIDLCNGPVFMQGFLDGNKLRFYDPALRLPANVVEGVLQKFFNLDVFSAMTIFAITGSFPSYLRDMQSILRRTGTVLVSLRVYIRSGQIQRIRGLEDVANLEGVFHFTPVYKEGDIIENWHDIRQSFSLIMMVYKNIDEAREATEYIYDTLQILDEKGEDMKLDLPQIPWLKYSDSSIRIG